MILQIKLLSDTAQIPSYAKQGDSGFDLHADNAEPIEIGVSCRAIIPTGLAVAVDESLELQVRPRSGIAWKHGVTVLNTPGTVDSGYRNEVGVILINHGSEPFVVKRGDRIAQGVIAPVVRTDFVVVSELPDSERGLGGFGHTGV